MPSSNVSGLFAFILITLQVSYIRFGTTYWDMSIRCFEY